MNALLGLLWLIIVIVAILDCLKNQKETKLKIIWLLVILFIPYVGAILYFVLGKKK